ncbi:BTAD domain-containing putative transcriptional regulator [Kitasatospora indigofera]|uniref:BTAD domain-containing putative transcriptional regulator n=1 Tax=Kitasatospora indigofera TaxID=67307 RepID=UPI0036835E13
MLRLHVLGPVEAHSHGGQVALGGPQQRAVLALLLIARGGVVPAERITDQLWRHTVRDRALTSLYPLISNLRRALEPGRPPRAASRVLPSVPPGYALRVPEEAVDAWRFEAAVRRARAAEPEVAWQGLKEALSWWQGPAYAEWAGHEWAVDEVARLDELHLMARELQLQVGLGAGHATEVVPSAEVLVRDAPLREDAWRLLALALWATGRQADALEALRRARSVLIKAVGLAPGQPLVELEEAILRGRREALLSAVPALARPDRAVTGPVRTQDAGPGASPPAPAGPAGHSAGPVPGLPRVRARGDELLIGRRAELRTLTEAARAAARHGAVVLVAGEPGSGKSTLLDHFGRALRAEGWTVITGRCPEDDGAPPAWAWVQALRELARIAPPADDGPLASLLHPGDTRTALPADPAAGRFRVHTALQRWLSEAAAEQPLALFMDDLHRADTETLMLLNRAASLRAPVLVVAAFRPDESGPRLGPLLAELARLAAHRLHLRGLDAPEVAEMLRTLCGVPVAPETVAALTERTGGNPFFVTESARLLAAEGSLKAVTEVPEAIRDVLRLRLAALSADQISVLRLAASCGREADLNVLVEASGLAPAQVFDALEACVGAGLLAEPTPGRVRFAHVLLRDVVYADLTGVRRCALHGRLAEVLERLRPNDLDALALHFLRSADPAKGESAVRYAVRAAERAERRYAHDVAADLLSNAVAVADHLPATAEDRAGRLVDLYGRLMRGRSGRARWAPRRRRANGRCRRRGPSGGTTWWRRPSRDGPNPPRG